jgi:small GTP-binding protein
MFSDLDSGLRAIFIGPENAGKTSLIHRLARNLFFDEFMATPTLGPAHVRSAFLAQNNSAVRVDLWDTPGQPTHRELMIPYLRHAHIVVLVFDVTSEESFSNLNLYYNKAKEVVSSDAPFFVLGNKTDLEHHPQLPGDLVQVYAEEIQALGYIDVSAKNGLGLFDFARRLADIAVQQRHRRMEAQTLDRKDVRESNKCGC